MRSAASLALDSGVVFAAFPRAHAGFGELRLHGLQLSNIR